MAKQKNILLVVVDCLRADRLFGDGATAHVPTIERLISGGTAFSHLITSNSMTTPCMTSLFSGLYPRSSGVRAMRGARIGDDIPLLAELLASMGYHTYAETTGPLGPYLHLDRGFKRYRNREGVADSFLGAWGDEFIHEMGSRALPEPWFMYLHLWEVHMPRQVLPQFDAEQYGLTKYDRAISSVDHRLSELLAVLDENTMVVVTGDHGEKIADEGMALRIEGAKGAITHQLRRRIRGRWRAPYERFVGSARSMWLAGSGLLYRKGMLDNPLDSITGHGFHVYDSLVRVPLIVSSPDIQEPGLIVDQPIRQVDIMPTLLDLAGGDEFIPDHIDGRSVRPLLEGESMPDLPAYIETCQNPTEPADLYGVRTSEWKFACHISDDEVPDELYELRSDPLEKTSVAAANPETVAELRALLDAHLSSPTRQPVPLGSDLTVDEMKALSDHLRNLGYVE